MRCPGAHGQKLHSAGDGLEFIQHHCCQRISPVVARVSALRLPHRCAGGLVLASFPVGDGDAGHIEHFRQLTLRDTPGLACLFE
jgi:hypothetical protein